MRHLRIDYQNRIVDLAGLIPENEPVFLLRAKDICSVSALHAYLYEVAKVSKREMIKSVSNSIDEFTQYQRQNINLLKCPDLGEQITVPVSDSPQMLAALNKIESLESELNKCKMQNLNLSSTADLQHHALCKNDDTISENEKRISDQENKIEELSGYLRQLREDFEVKSFELRRLSEAYSSLFSENEALSKVVFSKNETISELSREIESYKKSFQKKLDESELNN